VKWLADECFDNDIVRGLLRRFREFATAVVGEILLLDQCSEESDWAAGVIYLPLR
jgi:hypothetical protein